MKKIFLCLFTLTLLAQSNHLGTLTLGNRLQWDDPNTNRTDISGYRLHIMSATGTTFILEKVIEIDTNRIFGWQLTNWLAPGLKRIAARTMIGPVESDDSEIVYLTFDPSKTLPPVNFRIITELRTTTIVTNLP